MVAEKISMRSLESSARTAYRPGATLEAVARSFEEADRCERTTILELVVKLRRRSEEAYGGILEKLPGWWDGIWWDHAGLP